MTKKLLFISPDHFDFYKVVLTGFQKYSSCDVFHILIDEHHRNYQYKNGFERIQNAFMKVFLNKNLKKEKIRAKIIAQINAIETYDYLFINRPDIIDADILQLLHKKSKKRITYYWDSFDKIKTQKATMKYFDKCYSFDINDCNKYNLIYTHNFHFNEPIAFDPIYDVYYIGSYDKRHSLLLDVIEIIQKSGKNVHADLFFPRLEEINEEPHPAIDFIDKIIPFPDVSSVLKKTKIILDIHHNNQLGLSFRVFDAMGMKKKLITTNPDIKKYDFYNPNNIFVIDENTTVIPTAFFDLPYEEIPENLFEKYSLKNWVETIINN